jgi:hypothetical protein
MAIDRKSMRRAIVEGGRDYLVWSNQFAPLYVLNKAAYAGMEQLICMRMRKIPGVCTIYLTHGLALGECYPGLTDFDLVVLFEATDRLTFYETFRRHWGALKRFLPVSDVLLVTKSDFETWQRLGGGWDPLDEVWHWICLWGNDLRCHPLNRDTQNAAMDRLRYGLGHFQNLIQVAIKEEHISPIFAIVARRQIYKCFWASVLAMDRRYLDIPNQQERVAAWIQDHGEPEPVLELLRMYQKRFHQGPVSRVRFSAGALAYQVMNEAIARMPCAYQPLRPPLSLNEPSIPIANHREVEERAWTMSASTLEMIGDRVESIVLSSTGSVRGYALYIVLRDDLKACEVEEALVDLRAIHRVFDDPWFNEHFPAGIPILCSRTMFLARLQTGRSSLHYFHAYRRVLHGKDFYAEALQPQPDVASENLTREDMMRERLIFSLNLHQIYLGRLKPALYDFVTLYYLRMALQQETGYAPATAEEAVFHYARRFNGKYGEFLQRFMEQYRGKDLNALQRTMSNQVFAEVWPFFQQEIRIWEPSA